MASTDPDGVWFHAWRDRDGARTAGRPQVSLGHRLARPVPPDDGGYVGWSWDGRRLVVENDRYGLYPLYYHATDDRVAVSPSVPRLLGLGLPRDLDEDALAAFLAVGYYLADDTCFRADRALPGRATLSWSVDGWSLESAGRSGFRVQAHARRSIVEGTIERMRVAIGRRLEGAGCIMPVSGGRDSRHILLELDAQGHRPLAAVTAHWYPHEGDNDLVPAAVLCAAVGVPHRVLPPPGHSSRRSGRRTG